MAHKTGVVLVNWNTSEYTTECIRSLLCGSMKPDVIVVIDNASSDDSIARISYKFPEVVLLQNLRNMGFATANNQGIQLLLNLGMDALWVLNNDTVVSGDCLKTLVEATNSHPQITAFSGKIFKDTFPEQLWYAGSYRHSLHGAPKHVLDNSLLTFVVNGVVEVPFISGCCMFVPSWAFRKYGGFIESYIAYYEDSEWCWRVTNRGAKLAYVPNATLMHKVSASVEKNDKSESSLAFVTYLMARNQFWTVRLRGGNIFGTSAFIIINLAMQVRNILFTAARGQFRAAALAAASLRDGLFRNVPADFPTWD